MVPKSYNMNCADRLVTYLLQQSRLVSVITLTNSITTSPNFQDLHGAPCSPIESLWPLWQMGAVILDQCSLCLQSRSPLPLDLSFSDRASKEGAFMRANLHLHCCKLRPQNEASGETAYKGRAGRRAGDERERESSGRGRTSGQQIKKVNFFFKQEVGHQASRLGEPNSFSVIFLTCFVLFLLNSFYRRNSGMMETKANE